LRRIYYLFDENNHPVVTVGVFKEENGIPFARTIAVYGNGESHPINKEQARNMVNERFDNAESILRRPGYENHIFAKRVNSIYDRIYMSPKNDNRDNPDSVLQKIDLRAEPTNFEKYLMKIKD